MDLCGKRSKSIRVHLTNTTTTSNITLCVSNAVNSDAQQQNVAAVTGDSEIILIVLLLIFAVLTAALIIAVIILAVHIHRHQGVSDSSKIVYIYKRSSDAENDSVASMVLHEQN